MKIVEITNVESSPNPHGVDARKLYDTENAVAVHMGWALTQFLYAVQWLQLPI